MTAIARHGLPIRDFRALSRGEGGAEAVETLSQALWSRELLLLWNISAAAKACGFPQARMAEEGYRLIAAVQRHDAASAKAVLSLPSVYSWALLATGDLTDETAGHVSTGRLAVIAAAAAVRAGMPCRITVPGPDRPSGTMHLPSLGLATAVPAGRSLVLVHEAGRLSFLGAHGETVLDVARLSADMPGWQAERTLSADSSAGTLRILLDDLDPHRFAGALGPAGRTSADDFQRWTARLDEAWSFLADNHKGSAHEIRAAVRAFCPLQSTGGHTVSASSRAAPGSIALTRPDSALALAMTMVHEVQHIKLAALMDTVPLLGPRAGDRRYYAPWRDDPRPLEGLLQGTYAHLGVAGFWRRQILVPGADSEALFHAQVEFARWREAAALTATFLSTCTDLTPVGREFAAGMAGRLRAWQREHVPAAARVRARQAARAHRAQRSGARRRQLPAIRRFAGQPGSGLLD